MRLNPEGLFFRIGFPYGHMIVISS
jgi:hypothetical protein